MEILASRKYREMGLCADTVRDLLERELPLHRSQRDALKAARQKLHNIVAPYLGDPDYPAAAKAFADLAGQGDDLRPLCRQMLEAHASTRERLPLLDGFYPRLFEITGQPSSVLDLACGLNPFALPWMGLAQSVRYLAYDLHSARAACIGAYFKAAGLSRAEAVAGDVLLMPLEQADVGLFFKEAHRFEQRQRGVCAGFFKMIPVRWLLVSLPTASLTGRHDLRPRHRDLVYSALDGTAWPVVEVEFESELVFCIHKEAA
ncbi:MAG TPA: hypothetical protein PKW33_04995 [Anaerolineaceae bacterium]|nr:hypothetical protein [Anaerolineaceae bacterium]HPN50920.1 hypothetical protein [Anaerolineaceae bacterium]